MGDSSPSSATWTGAPAHTCHVTWGHSDPLQVRTHPCGRHEQHGFVDTLCTLTPTDTCTHRQEQVGTCPPLGEETGAKGECAGNPRKHIPERPPGRITVTTGAEGGGAAGLCHPERTLLLQASPDLNTSSEKIYRETWGGNENGRNPPRGPA